MKSIILLVICYMPKIDIFIFSEKYKLLMYVEHPLMFANL
ncbi:hypothetical protein M085_4749 [Bacteroides fragilis str. 3986 N(B)19]|nr:hypothetical protein M085_4749 [Bacteroides fragilis str. 3986 N(B)19]